MAAALVALGALVLALVAPLLDDPARLELTVENPTEYDVSITVRGPGEASSLGLGTVRAEATRTFAAVVDQGETWEFEFGYGGEVGGTVTVDRADLVADGLRVPAEVGERFREAGLPPSP